MAAPIAAPITLDIPPTTEAKRKKIIWLRLKVSGAIKPSRGAIRAPDRPPRTLAIRNARSLADAASMPMLRAAFSLSRTARQPQPGPKLIKLWTPQHTTAAMTRTKIVYGTPWAIGVVNPPTPQSPPLQRDVSEAMPGIRNGSIRVAAAR